MSMFCIAKSIIKLFFFWGGEIKIDISTHKFFKLIFANQEDLQVSNKAGIFCLVLFACCAYVYLGEIVQK